MLNVWLAVPPLVVKEVSPKLLVKVNAPSPPTVFFTTATRPNGGRTTAVFVNVQVVVAPDTTVMAACVPLVQLALVCTQPEGTVSLML